MLPYSVPPEELWMELFIFPDKLAETRPGIFPLAGTVSLAMGDSLCYDGRKRKGGHLMKDFDWELLHELYKNPNMTRVANILYITQPSLTKRLQRIEAEFDVTIVERTPKGLEFTPEGKYLAEQAEVYLRFLKQTRSHLVEMHEENRKVLNIGTSYTYGKYALTEILMRYRMQFPDVTVSIHSASSHFYSVRWWRAAWT